MAKHDLTPEEAAAGRRLSLEAREARHALKERVRTGAMSFPQLLEIGERDSHKDRLEDSPRVAGRIDVGDALIAVADIGPVYAGEILARAAVIAAEDENAEAIDPDTNLDELSVDEVDGLRQAFEEWAARHAAEPGV